MTPGLGESITLADAISHYLVHLSADARALSQQELNRFIRWLGPSRTLNTLSSHEVASYTEKLGSTTADLAKRLEPVKTFLAYAKKEGYTETNLGVNLRAKKAAAGSPASKSATERSNLTREGYDRLVTELEGLKAERPRIAQALHLAMEDKDFRENAPLDAARDEQAHLEAHIRELEAILKRADIIEHEPDGIERVQLGNTVVLWDEGADEEFRMTLVHQHEANFAQGKLSAASPLGKAVLERTAGEQVEVEAPGGVHRYRIKTIEAGHTGG